jgi:hypothetical protein
MLLCSQVAAHRTTNLWGGDLAGKATCKAPVRTEPHLPGASPYQRRASMCLASCSTRPRGRRRPRRRPRSVGGEEIDDEDD